MSNGSCDKDSRNGCGSGISPVMCQDLVDRVEGLNAGFAKIPRPKGRGPGKQDHPPPVDLMQYFGVLKHLGLREGFVLDCLYREYFLTGYPLLYTRGTSEKRYVAFDEYAGAREESGHRESYLNEILVEDREEGYLELAILRTLGGRFWLFQHACYWDQRILCTKSALQRLLERVELPVEVVRSAGELDLTPRVRVGMDRAEVHMIMFSQWVGFYRDSLRIRRQFPHTIEKELRPERLVAYDCDVRF